MKFSTAQLTRIDELLPPPPPPAASYVPVREAGRFLYVAGQTPHVSGKLAIRGRVGDDVSAEQARALAETAALNVLSALQAHLGDLRELERMISVTGFVACTPEFGKHPWVIDGASRLLSELLGEAGQHARAAVGVQSLPDGAPVELSVVAYRTNQWSASAQ